MSVKKAYTFLIVSNIRNGKSLAVCKHWYSVWQIQCVNITCLGSRVVLAVANKLTQHASLPNMLQII